MTSTAAKRRHLSERLRRDARTIIEGQGVTAYSLATILGELKTLAVERDLWGEAEFPVPGPDQRQARYLIGVDEDSTYALYLNVMRPGKAIPPHDHTTWSCIAAVEGVESNRLYRRLDDGTVVGRARIVSLEEIEVGPGSGIALMPDDIHSVAIRGEGTTRHLHMYGRALETLTRRLTFDPVAGTCQPMQLGVRTITSRERRPY